MDNDRTKAVGYQSYADIVKNRHYNNKVNKSVKDARCKIEQHLADVRYEQKQEELKGAWTVYINFLAEHGKWGKVEKQWDEVNEIRKKKFEAFYSNLQAIPSRDAAAHSWSFANMYDFVKQLWRNPKSHNFIVMDSEEKHIFRMVVSELAIFKFIDCKSSQDKTNKDNDNMSVSEEPLVIDETDKLGLRSLVDRVSSRFSDIEDWIGKSMFKSEEVFKSFSRYFKSLSLNFKSFALYNKSVPLINKGTSIGNTSFNKMAVRHYLNDYFRDITCFTFKFKNVEDMEYFKNVYDNKISYYLIELMNNYLDSHCYQNKNSFPVFLFDKQYQWLWSQIVHEMKSGYTPFSLMSSVPQLFETVRQVARSHAISVDSSVTLQSLDSEIRDCFVIAASLLKYINNNSVGSSNYMVYMDLETGEYSDNSKLKRHISCNIL